MPTAGKKAPKKRKPKQPAKKPDGRSKRGKYEKWLTEEGLQILSGWSRNGLSYEQIAKNCGCSLSTLKDWREKYPPISEALSRAREEADTIVENALFKTANGYTVKVGKWFKLKRVEYDPETGKKLLEQEYLEERQEDVHIPANERAQEFWLRNRKPDVWRDKPVDTTDHSNAVEVTFDVDEEEEACAESADPAAEPES